MNDKNTVGDYDPVNRELHRRAAELSEKRFEYLVSKRDSLLAQIRFGALTINGASLIGLATLLGDKQTALAALGIGPDVAKQLAAFFLVGAALAATSIWAASLRITTEVGDAFDRMLKSSWLSATYESEMNTCATNRTRKAMDDFYKSQLTDFHYSWLAMVLQSMAGACWIAGVVWAALFASGLL